MLRISHTRVMILPHLADETFARSPDCILRHRIRTRLRFRRRQMCNPSVGLQGQEISLIGLVTGPHNFDRGERVAVLLLAAAFIAC